MRLMYMDECKAYQHTGIVSLTAMVVDEQDYVPLRKALFRSLGPYIRTAENTYASPPELHGNSLLREIDDNDEKFKVLEKVFRAVADTSVRLYRCGYYMSDNLPDLLRNEKALLDAAYFGIQCMTQPEFSDQIVMPIMDGVDSNIAFQFGASNHLMASMISNGPPEGTCSINNLLNLAETAVSSRKYSICTQCVDLISYALHCSDWINQGLRVSDFKRRFSSLTNILDDSLRKNEVVQLNMGEK